MRKRSQYARAVSTERAAGGQVGTATTACAFNPLSLPSLTRIIPTYTPRTTELAWADLALACLEAGLLPEAEEVDLSILLVQKALSQWLEGLQAGLQFVDEFRLQVVTRKEREGDSLQPLIFVVVPNEPDGEIVIGPGFERLEAVREGLGQTVLDLMESAGGWTCGIWTPGSVFHEAQYLYWQGTDTDKDFLEEMRALEGLEEGDELPEDEYFLPSQFVGDFPPWAINAKAVLGVDDLKAVAQTAEDPSVREIASLAADLHVWRSYPQDDKAMLPRLAFEAEYDPHESAYRSSVLRWSDCDAMGRVLDDFQNHRWEASDYYSEEYGNGVMPLKLEDFQKWKADFEAGMKLYKTLDQLIALVAGLAESKKMKGEDHEG